MSEFNDQLREKAFNAMQSLYLNLVSEIRSDNPEEDFMVMTSAVSMALLHLRNNGMCKEDWAEFNLAIFEFLERSLNEDDEEEGQDDPTDEDANDS